MKKLLNIIIILFFFTNIVNAAEYYVYIRKIPKHSRPASNNEVGKIVEIRPVAGSELPSAKELKTYVVKKVDLTNIDIANLLKPKYNTDLENKTAIIDMDERDFFVAHRQSQYQTFQILSEKIKEGKLHITYNHNVHEAINEREFKVDISKLSASETVTRQEMFNSLSAISSP